MRTVRSLGRLALSSVLVVGVMLGALLPPEHMHLAGIEGRTHSVVHRHSLQGSGSGPSSTSIAAHGSHERALFMSTFYDSVARFLTHAPAVVETAIRGEERCGRAPAPGTHDGARGERRVYPDGDFDQSRV